MRFSAGVLVCRYIIKIINVYMRHTNWYQDTYIRISLKEIFLIENYVIDSQWL